MVFILGCGNPSKEDMEKLKVMENKYGKEFEFKLRDDVYLFIG